MPRGDASRFTSHPGRPKGCKNKFTTNVRDAIMQSFQNRGGVKWLDSLPNDEFAKLFAKIIPQTMEMSGLDGLVEAMNAGAKRADAERS